MAGAQRALVLLSGGIDSTTALYWARAQGWELFTLTIDYAQGSKTELPVAEPLSKLAGANQHFMVSLPFYKEIQDRYAPREGGQSPAPVTGASAYVPARNLVFYGIAAAFAEALGAEYIVFGSNADDARELPDATPAFLEGMNRLIGRGTRMGTLGRPAKIVNPLILLSKAQALRKALELRVPLERTWSCYQDVTVPCGRCRGCISRRRAFDEIGMKDPIRYAE